MPHRPRHPIVLASASPRRSTLLRDAGVPFRVQPANIEEVLHPGEKAEAFALRLAREKALWVAEQLPGEPPQLVLGADTVVAEGGRILGKPRDAEHAVELLASLVGKGHRVITGVAVVATADRTVNSLAVTSRVRMRPVERAELVAYAATGEPLDKAGAYAFQGEGRRFVTEVDGSETNVIGLPVRETLGLLGLTP
ncbi:MAG: Maf family protein [Proteobacteria bacterium]|nr:Maf family protein [Pseudomonadota bacterium]